MNIDLSCISELQWRHSCFLLEEPTEILGGVEPQAIGYLVGRKAGRLEKVLGFVDEEAVDELLGVLTDGLSKQVAQIVRGHVHLFGNGLWRDHLHGVGLKITVHELLYLHDAVLLHAGPRPELAGIITVGIVEQERQFGDDDGLCIVIHIDLMFAIDILDDGFYMQLFLVRQMECLAHIVGEETVSLDLLAQRISTNEVGMEEHHPSLGSCCVHIVILTPDDLPRSIEVETAGREVILAPSIPRIAGTSGLAGESIEIQLQCLLHLISFTSPQAGDPDERMPLCLIAKQVEELFHAVDLNNILHHGYNRKTTDLLQVVLTSRLAEVPYSLLDISIYPFGRNLLFLAITEESAGDLVHFLTRSQKDACSGSLLHAPHHWAPQNRQDSHEHGIARDTLKVCDGAARLTGVYRHALVQGP